MNYINNYAEQVALAEGATALALALPDGSYRLTLSDARGADATRWEYVDAQVVSGAATLVRGAEGSTAQDWPAGSWVYCSVTAGALNDIFTQLAAQAATQAAQALQLADLEARMTALENASIPENSLRVTLGVEEAGASSYTAGWFEPGGPGAGYVGAVAPAALVVTGVGELTPVFVSAWYDEFEDLHQFNLAFSGNVTALLAGITSITVEGVGELTMAGAYEWIDDPGITQATWPGAVADWISGGTRLVTFNPA